jgi:hypothetical protein
MNYVSWMDGWLVGWMVNQPTNHPSNHQLYELLFRQAHSSNPAISKSVNRLTAVPTTKSKG